MKVLWIGMVLLLVSLTVRTNEYNPLSFNQENKLFIITLDGLRWQEVFKGADSTLLNNPFYTSDASGLKALYWSPSKDERRKKLMPFFWNIIARQGELYGNREYNNKMNVANPYALSYPGYNELLTGDVDLSIFNNGKTANQNVSVLEILNASPTYQNKVAAFASWDAFPYILNKEKSSVFINSGFDELQGNNLSPTEAMINSLQAETEDQKNTRYDELTYLACKEYIQKSKPSVVLLSLGGTDEAAHQKKYDVYLQQANNADRMIGELWQYLQTLPEYANKTTFLITTDHGRGNNETNWHSHGLLVNGSSETWMGLFGNAVTGAGERKTRQQLYLKQVKNVMLKILSYKTPAS
ncbi:MAG TPA: alkaline phosphatase family protein [Flavisolibacter sp.]